MFNLFGKKAQKIENCYAVDVVTDFEKEDIEFMQPIITINFSEKINPEVEMTAIFSKVPSLDGITLEEAYTELSDIIKDCKRDNCNFKVTFSDSQNLTHDESTMVQNINNLVNYGK